MLKREEALTLVKENIKKENLFKHVLAVEAIMKGLSKYFNEDVELWGLVGLLHDIDFEKTMDRPQLHGLLAEEILKGKVSEEVIRAIKSHNFENTGVMPESKMENALVASDTVSGLIVACALVMPSKKLEEVNIESIEKKFKQKDFARACKRERILFCEKIGLSKEKFFEIALNSLKEISRELGL
ncbi:MAG: HDIG domain-containing protein [Candidatus Aenigmarchaeota archaeon]|nr:HDIG domain-containing protein [Candidatus Aenigmarchaeota archaeon]MDW8149130.1 HDIG domain-containing protein [Candidatus Aenigmarchaeota archaeon]